MDASINIYHKPDRVAVKIRNVSSELMLPTKLSPIQLPVAEVVPKNLVGLSLGLPQPPSNPSAIPGLTRPFGHYCARIYHFILSPLHMGGGPEVRA